MYRYRRLIRYALRQWPILLLILALGAATSASTALQPWPMKLLIDQALGHTPVPGWLRGILMSASLRPTPATLLAAAAMSTLGLFALSSLIDAGTSWAWTAAGQRMVYELAGDLFYRLQRLSLHFHSRHSVGDSLSRLTGDTWCIYSVTGSLLISPGQHVLTLATVSALAWHMDHRLTLLSLLVAPALGASALFFGGRLKKRAQLGREAQSRLLSFVHQTLTAIPVVQAFGREKQNGRQFRRQAADVVTLSQQSALLQGSQGWVNGFTTTVGSAVILYLGGERVLAGTLSVGSLLVFIAYLRAMQSAVQGLMGIYTVLKTTGPSIDRVSEVLEAEEQVPELPHAHSLRRARGLVRLDQITFGYHPGPPVLHSVSLAAHPGETLALVGPTGAGKSTLVSLIPRFFDPWEGQVTLDGRDLRELQLDSLRAQIALVLQEPFLLPLTVAENIAYGRPGASRAQIEAAASAANAAEFIERLPAGYDTVIGERGATLSGGERQRLAIARALLKDAPILILDEPTSALDARTEAQLLAALERLMAGRTTFIIAHRLSTIRRADRIVVVEGGRVVEEGDHDELLARGGLYAHLHDAQRQGTQLDPPSNRPGEQTLTRA